MDTDHVLYESAFNFAPIGMAMVSLEGKFLKVNQSLCDFLGFTGPELLNTDFQTITLAEDLEIDILNVGRTLKGEINSYSMEKRYIRKDKKTVWAHLFVSLIRDERNEPQFFCSQIMDISEIKRVQMALFYNSKMTALGEMVGGLAHEINNPLTIIGLNASSLNEVLKDQDIDRNMAKNFLKKITDTVTRINNIVVSLRRLSSRTETLTFQKASLETIVNDALTICFEKFKAEGVVLETKIKDVQFECRPVEISQVLVNLLNNAFHAVKKTREKKITVSTDMDRNKIIIEICDTGPGVPDSLKARIMEPFFSTKPVGEGTGIGLSISRNIIDSHNGKMYLADTDFTKFVVELPRIQI